jgi:hypothetical protein
MNYLLFIAYFFIFTWFTLAEVSPIAGHVERINRTIPENQRRENTVNFLKDPKVWEFLKDAAKKDIDGVKKLLQEMDKITDESFPLDEKDPNFDKFKKAAEQFVTYRENGLKDKEAFSTEEAIRLFADTLVARNEVKNLPQADKKPLGDLVERMSLTMKKLNSKIWDEEFYRKLLKAAENQKYDNQTSDNQTNDKKNGNQKNGNQQNDVGNWKEYLPHILLAVVIVAVLVGVIVFVILRNKRQIKP